MVKEVNKKIVSAFGVDFIHTEYSTEDGSVSITEVNSSARDTNIKYKEPIASWIR